jgi:hypothetical protein
MNRISVEDFLKLIQDSQEEDYTTESEEEVWANDHYYLPDKYKKLEKFLHFKPPSESIIDLTNCKKDDIQELLFKSTKFKIGKFTLTINKYYGIPGDAESSLALDIRLMEHRIKTPNGSPCNMDFDIDIMKDSRFKNRAWLSYFNTKGRSYGIGIPTDVVVDIVRWLQAITKLCAFL